jgi:hypothetical protein
LRFPCFWMAHWIASRSTAVTFPFGILF